MESCWPEREKEKKRHFSEVGLDGKLAMPALVMFGFYIGWCKNAN